MLTVLLVLVSLLTVDLLFVRGVQFVNWVRGLDPVVTREVDAVNNVVVKDVTNSEEALNAAKKTLASLLTDTEVAVVADTKVVDNAVSTVAADVSTVATDVAKEATAVVADVKKL